MDGEVAMSLKEEEGMKLQKKKMGITEIILKAGYKTVKKFHQSLRIRDFLPVMEKAE